jgi:hypothetical protein
MATEVSITALITFSPGETSFHLTEMAKREILAPFLVEGVDCAQITGDRPKLYQSMIGNEIVQLKRTSFGYATNDGRSLPCVHWA